MSFYTEYTSCCRTYYVFSTLKIRVSDDISDILRYIERYDNNPQITATTNSVKFNMKFGSLTIIVKHDRVYNYVCNSYIDTQVFTDARLVCRWFINMITIYDTLEHAR